MAMQDEKHPAHPGFHIRNFILPTGLTVTEAAKRLGVGRPALSNLLNGKAALSPEMAVRLEKTFHVKASALLELQTRHDESVARASEHDFAVRAYSPPYRAIAARVIAKWAGSYIDARQQFPALLRTLVHSTSCNLTAVDFPAIDNSQRKGWDGQITSESATPWIPRGQSGWEFSCAQNPQAKAERDYRTRTNGTTAKERKSMTFVFVTARNWAGKGNWAERKRALGEWKDVRCLDASDLEQWLEQSIPGQIRMREFLGYGGWEVATLDEVWREWACATDPELPRTLFEPAVEIHRKPLRNWLKAPPSRPFVVTADSTLEGLAFLSCALKLLDKPFIGAYEQTIVIRSLEEFKSITRAQSNFIGIVDSSEVAKSLAGLQKKTHIVIVHRRNMTSSDADIKLDLLGYEAFRNGLRDTGLDDSRIDQLARESARSPTILRRRLAQVEAVKNPSWAADNSVARALVAFIFAGAWDSSIEADKKILSCLADAPYEDIEEVVAQLLTLPDSPVWSIGHLRGIASKIDALYAAYRILIAKDLKNFLNFSECVLLEQDPALELPMYKRWAAVLHGKKGPLTCIATESM